MKLHMHDATAKAPSNPQATRIEKVRIRYTFRIIALIFDVIEGALCGILAVIGGVIEAMEELDHEGMRDAKTKPLPAWGRWLIRAWNGEAGMVGALFMLGILIGVLCFCYWLAGTRGFPN